MPKIFEKVKRRRIKRSAFDLSRERKFSCDMGQLIPCYLEEIVPGDQFRVTSESLVRFAPMIAPIMHRVDVYIHYFFVPNRIVWNQWEDFITGGEDGLAAPVMPSIYNSSRPYVGELGDYLGLPTVEDTLDAHLYGVSQLPFRAYQQIYNDYYRDQNLEDEVDITSLADLKALRTRAWEKDYFTSALPWRQRGAASSVDAKMDYFTGTNVTTAIGGSASGSLEATLQGKVIDADGDLVDLRSIESISVLINDLRTSSAIQRFLETQATGGSRYIETILSQFGVRSSDERLQRAEYLGGGKQPVNISEVLNTSATTEDPQGHMAGHGISSGITNRFQDQFEEHGYVMGIFSVMPKSSYFQGIDRHWKRDDKFDFYWPEFANLGEQEVHNYEIIAGGDEQLDNATFGYQQRYAEYKYGKSSVHGDFRTTLKHWHLARSFVDYVPLSPSFVHLSDDEQSDLDGRIFAAPTAQNLWVQLYHDVKARRPMPYFADPRLT